MDSCRLFNGRMQSDIKLRHITIDRYGPLLLITTYSHHHIAESLLEQFSTQGITNICWRQRTGKKTTWKFLRGEKLESLVIEEDNLKFELRFSERQNIGLFLDMANIRSYIKHNIEGKKVLNLFAYTCSFSIAAIAGRAAEVTNVDMKSTFLSWGRKNHLLNGQSTECFKFLKHNILKSLGGYIKRGPFDLVIIDPPSYQPGGFKLKEDYPKILKKIDKLITPQGEALICSNDPLQSYDEFENFILQYIAKGKITKKFILPNHFDGLKIFSYTL